MTFRPNLRRLVVTTHVASSVGWAGAVLVFLAIAMVGLTSSDERTVRGTYLVMAPAAWLVLIPLAHATLISGVALSLGTPWELIRHYWVVIKLVLTVFATVILLIYMGTFRQMEGVAGNALIGLDAVRNPSPVLHSVLALIVLGIAMVLGIYKPFGPTSYGLKESVVVSAAGSASPPRGATGRLPLLITLLVGGLIVLLLVLHLFGAIPAGH